MHETEATSIVKQTLPMLVIMGLGGTVAGYFLSQAGPAWTFFPAFSFSFPRCRTSGAA
jgi:cation transporter-like permease